MGAGALEELQRRYRVKTYFDIEARGYVATCKASLDKSGRAGVQTIRILQPVGQRDKDIAGAIQRTMQLPGMEKAMVLFVVNDFRLPYGQLRMRCAYEEGDRRLKSAYCALGPENRVTTLHVGVGYSASSDFSAAEAGALPTVLGNAATAIEVWLSESDLGLVMRFVNRPQVYEDVTSDPVENEDESSAIYKPGSLVGMPSGAFSLFDLNREEPTEPPMPVLVPMSPRMALAALGERPPDVGQAIIAGGQRFDDLSKLTSNVVKCMFMHKKGMHIRMEDQEKVVKALMTYHSDGDTLLEDTVAIKIDSSPIDDNTLCFWAVKFDGNEEDFSFKTCLTGLHKWLHLEPPELSAGFWKQLKAVPEPVLHGHRPLLLGPGRWAEAARESTLQRAQKEEQGILDSNKSNPNIFTDSPGQQFIARFDNY